MSRMLLGIKIKLEYPLLTVIAIELIASVFDIYALNYLGGAILLGTAVLFVFGYEVKTLEDLGYPKGAILGKRNGPDRIIIGGQPYKKTDDNYYGKAVYIKEELV